MEKLRGIVKKMFRSKGILGKQFDNKREELLMERIGSKEYIKNCNSYRTLKKCIRRTIELAPKGVPEKEHVSDFTDKHLKLYKAWLSRNGLYEWDWLTWNVRSDIIRRPRI